MRCIIAAIGFLTFAASPAFAFYQQTIIFPKSLFVAIEKAGESDASEKADRQSAEKWRFAFTNPMS